MKLCDTCIYGDKYEFEKPCVIYSDDCKLYEEKKMDDMTRKRAISELEQIYGMLSPDKQRALDMAIKALWQGIKRDIYIADECDCAHCIHEEVCQWKEERQGQECAYMRGEE